MKFAALKSSLLLSSFALILELSCPSIAAYSADNEESIEADGPWISAVAWLDDTHLAGTSSQGLLLRPAKVVKAATDKLGEIEAVGEAETSLWCIRSLTDGKLVAGDYKGQLAIYGEGDPKPIELESRWIRALEVTADGQLIAGTEDGKLIVLSAGEHKETKRADASAAAIFDIAFNPAGDQVAIGCGDGNIKLFSWPALEEQGKMSRSGEAVWSLVYSADGSQLISGGADRRLQLWSVPEKRSIATITKTPDWVTSLVALPDSMLVAAGCMNGQIVVADYETLSKVDVDASLESGIWSLALSPDSQRIAAGTRKHGFAVMEVADWIAAGKQAAVEAKKIRPPSPE